MNKLEQAARQALEALIKANHFHDYEDEITALREALDHSGEANEMVIDWEAIGKEQLRRYKEKFGDFEQAEQEPVSKALLLATDALVYHTEQTRPIQKTDEAIIYLRNVMAQGVSSMAFTLEDAMAKYPEISYWHNEFLKHNTTSESAEQEPVAWTYTRKGIYDKLTELGASITKSCCNVPDKRCGADEWVLQTVQIELLLDALSATVRTKDLTDEEVMNLAMNEGAMGFDCEKISFARAVIAADRKKNK